ncbi:MAG TPA: hypothetical protein VGD36_20700 [Xanthobacteraceae bacterium]
MLGYEDFPFLAALVVRQRRARGVEENAELVECVRVQDRYRVARHDALALHPHAILRSESAQQRAEKHVSGGLKHPLELAGVRFTKMTFVNSGQ